MTNWTAGDLKVLHGIISQAGDNTSGAFKKAASKLGKSVSSCRRKWVRTNWNQVIGMEYGIAINDPQRRPWTHREAIELYDLRKNKKLNYDDISGILNRSKTSCERYYDRTNWDSVIGNSSVKKEIASIIDEEARQKEIKEQQNKNSDLNEIHAGLTDKLVDWLVCTVKSDPDILKAMDEETFNTKLEKMLANPDSKVKREDVTIGFEEIKSLAMGRLDAIGMTYPKTRELGPGRYIVVGDSHGKNTSLGMFQFLRNLNSSLKCDAILHLGHISDDADEISYEWRKFNNLIVVGMLPELHLLKKQIHKYDVVRQRIMLGNVSVENQYDSGDFVKKGVGRIDPMTLPDFVIVNCHRHEMHSHCGYKRERLIVSPGCLCKRHPINTIKMMIFKNGYPHMRVTHPHGYRKYNRQEQDSARWEKGLIIVEVDKSGKATTHPLRRQETRLGMTTSFAGTVYGENENTVPDRKIFVNADFHCNLHDPKVLDMQEQFCDNYKPDVHVNLGDVLDNRGLNHHMNGTNGPAFYHNGKRFVYRDSMVEIASARHIMKRMRDWAQESYFVVGNHERFSSDLAVKMPQLQDILTTEFLLDTDRMGIKVTQLKHTLDFGYIKFVHGDVKVWGGTGGSKVDKVANNYGHNTVMGNIHYPAIRGGCYSIPMTGLLDQNYNEADASQWMQGFCYADVFDGQCFVSIVTIMGGQCVVGGETYVPRDCSSWSIPSYKLRLDFEFEGPVATTPQKASRTPVETSKPTRTAKIRVKG